MSNRTILNADGSLMLVEVALEKNFYSEVDQHAEEQLSYILKGSVEFEVGGKKKVLESGDVQYIPSNEPHRVKVIDACTILDVFTPLRADLLGKA
ncbi:cupin domain-containing protein [Jeotgalibacillus sp. S-D1]|uniref:cupin domain-containing protein n=1 Tax=Jeotgalibacillus sp. S-D1 TaxID=2552189 RepID=UPI00105A2583|nr:cupin domain-containing protein [Jeotgalibacillus sp. S-D1]TDL30902.1 cupin domain-containing protein [Jeotgalibacillus sp. S-D1]